MLGNIEDDIRNKIDTLRLAQSNWLMSVPTEYLLNLFLSVLNSVLDTLTSEYKIANKLSAFFPYNMVQPSLVAFRESLINFTKPAQPNNPDSEIATLLARPTNELIPYPVTAHIVAGNTPLLSWEIIIASLLRRSCPILKLPSSDNAWTKFFINTLIQLEPKLAECIAFVDISSDDFNISFLLSNVDAVTAHGSDNTVETIHKQAPASTPFFGYPNRFSIAVISNPKNIKQTAQSLAVDWTRYYQMGCLSPKLIFIDNNSEEFIIELTKQLNIETTHYPNPIDFPMAASIQSELKNAIMNQNTNVYKAEDLRWTLFQSDKPYTPVFNITGSASISIINDMNDLITTLQPYRNHIQCVGYSGKETTELQFLADELNIPRLCPIGTMQTPPLGWNADGQSLFKVLSRWRKA